MAETVAATELKDALMEQLTRLAKSARHAGLEVSVEQVATLVRALGAFAEDGGSVIDRPTLKRLVGLTLGTCREDLVVLGLLVEALFPAPGSEPGTGEGDEDQVRLRARLLEAVKHGDRGEGAELGMMFAASAGDPGGSEGRGRLAQRVIRALDLSAMLAEALAESDEADPLRRQLARIAREATLSSMEVALHAGLARRAALARTDEAARDSPVDLGGLLDELARLPIAGGRRADQDRLQEAVRPLATRLAARARRRRRGGRTHLDFRRTIARSVASGGAPMELRYRRRAPRRPQIVVLADVSGSMADYASFTMGLLQALNDELPGLRCFAFVDGAGEVTGELLSRPAALGAQLPAIPGVVAADGRSDYRTAFLAFERVSTAVLTPGTSLVVLGDGRSRAADPGDEVLRRFSHRVRHIYWLTPEPETDWSEDDCHIERYKPWCHRVDSVATLGQLEAWVERVISSR